MKDEILVVSTNVVSGTIELTHGLTSCTTNDLTNGLANGKTIYDIWEDYRFYIPKDEAEKSVEVEQLMPFVIIRNEFNEYYTFENTDKFFKDYKVTELRKKSRSLGARDHIYKSKCGYKDPIFKGAFDIILDNGITDVKQQLKFKGFVKNYLEMKSNHLGFVLLLEQTKNKVPKQDKEYYKSKWLSKNELIDKYGQFDMWSKLVIDYLVDNEL